MKNNIFKCYILTLLLASIFQQMMSQSLTFCHTSSDFPDLLPLCQQRISSIRSANGPYYVRVFFHIVRNSAGGGDDIAAANQMEERMQILNNDFNPHNIFFLYEGFDYVDNDTFYYFNGSNSVYLNMVNTQRVNNAINIYLLPTNGLYAGGKSEGIPGSAFIIGSSIDHNGYIEDMGVSHVLSHEMGHCLGLFHTFHEYGGCGEFVDGSNCLACGDRVCDTPADDFPNIKNLIYTSPDPSSCFWLNETIRDAHGDLYNPDFSLIMSYNYPHCMTHFTDGQGLRMRNYLVNYLSHVIQSVTQNDVYIQNSTFNNDTIIFSANNIIAGKNVTYGTIGDVTIDTGHHVSFISGNKIILRHGFHVEKGGFFRAIIDNLQNQNVRMRSKINENRTKYLSLLENTSWLVISLGYEGEKFCELFVKQDKDTIINTHSYKIIRYYSGEICDNKVESLREYGLMFIREDINSKKVFRYNTTNNSDGLLYDFGVEVGDIVTRIGEVIDVKYITNNDIERKQITIDSNPRTIWLEGVGGISSVFSFYSAEDNSSKVVCIKQQQNTVYENPFREVSCDIFDALPTHISNVRKSILMIYPNPVTDKLNVILNNLNYAYIYNLSGQPVLQTTETEIDVSALPAGMYILRAITTDGEQLQSKFIKQ